MGKRIVDVLHTPVENRAYIWLITVGLIVGLAFAGGVALLFTPK